MRGNTGINYCNRNEHETSIRGSSAQTGLSFFYLITNSCIKNDALSKVALYVLMTAREQKGSGVNNTALRVSAKWRFPRL